MLVEPDCLGAHPPWSIPSSMSEGCARVNIPVPLTLIRTFLSGPYVVPELSVGPVKVALGGTWLNLTSHPTLGPSPDPRSPCPCQVFLDSFPSKSPFYTNSLFRSCVRRDPRQFLPNICFMFSRWTWVRSGVILYGQEKVSVSKLSLWGGVAPRYKKVLDKKMWKF